MTEDEDYFATTPAPVKPPFRRRAAKVARRVVRALTAWAWEEEVERYVTSANGEALGARRYAQVLELRETIMEELFREKQAKIKRLQDAYKAKRSPMYEDMRLENPIKDAESLVQSISALAARAESYRAHTGRQMTTSDGTVLGVPGDRPNEPVGEAWR